MFAPELTKITITRQEPIWDNIPPELKQIPHWVCWTLVERNGKYTKPPVNPKTLQFANVEKPETWGTFEQAKQAFLKNKHLYGVGFVITPELGLTGIDFDDCIQNDQILWGLEDIKAMNTYTEVSPSGSGVHILAYGQKVGKACKKDKVEIYCDNRYLTVTGKHLSDTPKAIEKRQEEITRIYQKYIYDQVKPELALATPTPTQKASSGNLDDQQILEKARKSRNSGKFKSLWEGNWECYYDSQSEAELALCSMLAFWTQQDYGQTDRMFRSCALYRQKWDERHGAKTYGQATIEKAIATVKASYSPKRASKNTGGETGHLEHFTDMGNARRFAKDFGDLVRYCYKWESWLIWDGLRWNLDESGQIYGLAKKAVQNIYNEASQVDNDALRKDIAKHAIKSEFRLRIEAMLALAKSEHSIPVTPDKLDTNNWKLNVLNGTIDLKTGKLLPHNKADLITRMIPIEYDPDAQCPLWLRFLERIMANNQNLIGFLQRAAGYSITGDVSEQVLFFLHGTGANGKSTLLEIFMGVLDKFAIQAAPDVLMMRQYESHPTSIADLFGKRFVATIETEEGKRLAESLVKQITGGDRIKARFMRQDFFEFKPTFKIWLAANHKPIIRGTDYAIWRRIRMIPFQVTIPIAERDKMLGEKLKAEYPGILAWLVKGCLEWQKEGLKEPEEVIAATKSYQDEMDVFGRFLQEETVQVPQFHVQASALYDRYKTWCEQNGEMVMTGTAFGKRMTEFGFEKEHTKSGTFYRKIGLRQ